jgi:hypothetical protein
MSSMNTGVCKTCAASNVIAIDQCGSNRGAADRPNPMRRYDALYACNVLM